MQKAAKNIDKLSQWTAERFLKEGKTEFEWVQVSLAPLVSCCNNSSPRLHPFSSSSFRDAEKDIEARRKGVENLHAASSAWVKALSKVANPKDFDLR